ncbi:hypothetical protein UM93_08240 [Psychromicrobium lacuslunae]|uniref:Uncharacterized protein n=1 Tax=Psychromicrobium lacuslunae TaxID=1618207 RepID=A0A0D4BZI7_9MICC|nr:hypothetical protein UM93_08240 [Psychromicrobium lacuslunae]
MDILRQCEIATADWPLHPAVNPFFHPMGVSDRPSNPGAMLLAKHSSGIGFVTSFLTACLQ